MYKQELVVKRSPVELIRKIETKFYNKFRPDDLVGERTDLVDEKSLSIKTQIRAYEWGGGVFWVEENEYQREKEAELKIIIGSYDSANTEDLVDMVRKLDEQIVDAQK